MRFVLMPWWNLLTTFGARAVNACSLFLHVAEDKIFRNGAMSSVGCLIPSLGCRTTRLIGRRGLIFGTRKLCRGRRIEERISRGTKARLTWGNVLIHRWHEGPRPIVERVPGRILIIPLEASRDTLKMCTRFVSLTQCWLMFGGILKSVLTRKSFSFMWNRCWNRGGIVGCDGDAGS